MAKPTRSLVPREHGAYAELAFPLLTGLGMGRPSVASWAFALAAALFFFLHEPLAVVAGVRGERARRDHGRSARKRAILIAAWGSVAALIALLSASGTARMAALVPGGFAVLLAPLVLTGRVKNIAGEILVAGALAGVLLPVAVAGGAEWSYAVLAAGVWFTSFTLATFTVHALKARVKERLSPQWTVVVAPVLALTVLLAAVLVAYSASQPRLAALALVPPALATLAANAVGVHPRRLKRVGWSLVAANVLTAALLLGS